MKNNFYAMLEFFRRDIYVYHSRFFRYVLQYVFWYPTLFGICWAYLVPRIGSGEQSSASPVIFVGTLLFAMTSFAFAITADFLFDFAKERFVEYQLLLIPAWLILVQKILFNGLFMFAGMLAFIPFSKLIFCYLIDLPYVSWVGTLAMLLAGSFFLSSFLVAFACYAKGPGQVRHFWRRISYPMGMLGGFLIPWKVLFSFSPLVGSLVLLNPYLYLTEGLRSAILGGNQFFPWPLCVGALFLGTLTAGGAALHFFKKKIDPATS